MITAKDLITKKIPQHIAIIMDGNGRWAKKRSLLRLDGHNQGAKSVNEAINACLALGVKHLTLYAFSTENWQRGKHEVQGLIHLLEKFLRQEQTTLVEKSIRFLSIGDISMFPAATQQVINDTKQLTLQHDKLNLHLSLSYGGREEITRACRLLVDDAIANKINPAIIDEELLQSYLYTSDTPDPDLMIRTSGEQRLSNFLLWQLSYTELYFTDVLWPDFTEQNLLQAVQAFQQRSRRFGK